MGSYQFCIDQKVSHLGRKSRNRRLNLEPNPATCEAVCTRTWNAGSLVGISKRTEFELAGGRQDSDAQASNDDDVLSCWWGCWRTQAAREEKLTRRIGRRRQDQNYM